MKISRNWIRTDLGFAVRKAGSSIILKEDRMKARLYSVLLVLMLFGQNNLEGRPSIPSTPQSTSSSIAMPYYLAKVIARTADGKLHYGLLAGVENDCLILKKEAREERVSYRDISKVTIESGKHAGSLMATGMVLGIYLGNVIFDRADGQPVAFIDQDSHSEFSYFLMDLVYASAGIGLGYLASLFEKGEAAFRFCDREADRLAEWDKLKDFLAGRPRRNRFHLTIQAGRVFTSISHRYRNALTNAQYYTGYGFVILSPDDRTFKYVDGARSLNLLRRVQLTASLQPKIEVGAAAVFAGEAGIGGSDYGDFGIHKVSQTYKAVGYYAVAAYRPLLGKLPKTIRWNVGLGLGASRIEFELSMYARGDYPNYQEKWAQHKLAETVPSGMAFTEFGYSINPNISLGLTADYVFGPSRKIPAFPEWNIPGEKIRLGNGCIGLAFGVHF